MSQPPADDGPGRAGDAWPDSFVVPDDISSLESDVAQWRREQAQARRAALAQRFWPRRLRRYGVTAPMLIVTLLLIGVAGGAVVLLGPRGLQSGGRAAAAPLAATTVAPGNIGGLLPVVDLLTATGTRATSRTIGRPAVLTLVPRGCDCRDAVRHTAASVVPYGVVQYAVAADVDDAQRLARVDTLHTVGIVDRDLALLGAFGVVGGLPTVVVTGADGTVRAVERQVGPTTSLTGDLERAVGPTIGPVAAG